MCDGEGRLVSALHFSKEALHAGILRGRTAVIVSRTAASVANGRGGEVALIHHAYMEDILKLWN
jgi:hypothetical protein